MTEWTKLLLLAEKVYKNTVGENKVEMWHFWQVVHCCAAKPFHQPDLMVLKKRSINETLADMLKLLLHICKMLKLHCCWCLCSTHTFVMSFYVTWLLARLLSSPLCFVVLRLTAVFSFGALWQFCGAFRGPAVIQLWINSLKDGRTDLWIWISYEYFRMNTLNLFWFVFSMEAFTDKPRKNHYLALLFPSVLWKILASFFGAFFFYSLQFCAPLTHRLSL